MEFGPYGVVRELGRGATTKVDLARDNRAAGERPGPVWVALKRPRDGLDAEARRGPARDIANEAAAGLRLDHPHLVTIFDAGEVGGVPYCTMRLVQGPTLRRVLAAMRSGPPASTAPLPTGLPADLALDWLASVADALAWAAVQVPGFVHRDLKPENLLVDAEGRIQVADYGLARFGGRPPGLSGEARVVRGTPCYMAPEQARGEALDPRTDVYALGLVGIELFTGFQRVSPDGAGDAQEALRIADAADPAEALGAVRRRFPEVASLLSAAVRRRRDERPGMDALRVRLGTLVHRLGGAAAARDRYRGWLRSVAVAPSVVAGPGPTA